MPKRYRHETGRPATLLLFLLSAMLGVAVGGVQDAAAAETAARAAPGRPAVERISFAARSDRSGYVVRVRTTGAVDAYNEPRVRGGWIEWKLYNTRAARTLQASSAPGPVERYRAEAEGAHLVLRFKLRPGAEVNAQAYRDRASDDLLMNVTFSGGIPARLASAEDSPAPGITVPRKRNDAREDRPARASPSASAPRVTGTRGNAGERWKLDTIVIDAGHGGKDPGAQAHGLNEKDVVLDIALKVGSYIEERLPGVDVVYTRDDDRFIPLSERGHIANRAGAKLFVSIHANAARNHAAYGTETYFLGTYKSDAAQRVMERENSVVRFEEDPEEYEDLEAEAQASKMLAQSMYLGESERLAGLVQDQFRSRVDRKDRGVHQAGFYVLWSASMPAVLVETGFITNRSEARFLGSERGQTLIASGVFRAVRAFKKQYEKGLNLATE